MPKIEPKFPVRKSLKLSEDQYSKMPPNRDFSEWIRELIDHEGLFKEAFQEVYSIFEKFAESPTSETAIELFSTANLEVIDKAREVLK